MSRTASLFYPEQLMMESDVLTTALSRCQDMEEQ
jgi:hypothetical protein